jgi:hypothetical protein
MDTLIFKIVTIKFIAPSIDEIPARCRLKIAKSIDGPECANALDKGGYNVQPVPAPFSTKVELNNNNKEGTNIQKETLFILGKLISGADNSNGIIQFPKPPIVNGIKK